jgi:alanyl-tRNA synthetase
MLDDKFIGYPRAFGLSDSHGLPLAMQMDYVESKGMRVALDVFVRDAVNAGWSFEKAIRVCEAALIEKHGPKVGKEQARRLEDGMKKFWERYWPLEGEVRR